MPYERTRGRFTNLDVVGETSSPTIKFKERPAATINGFEFAANFGKDRLHRREHDRLV